MVNSFRKIFLIDGSGALLTAMLLYFLIHHNALTFGILPSASQKLSIIACAMAAFSFGCYFFVLENHARFLRIIAIANILYCITTVILLSSFFGHITPLGFIYFSVEGIIILVLVVYEFRLSKNGKHKLRTDEPDARCKAHPGQP